jgi:exopolysaccharide production protein ExoZ
VTFVEPVARDPSTRQQETFLSIQALRAFAAYAVVLFHFHLAPVGFAGVDLFFVISGFIMGQVGVRESPSTFLSRRVIRIVPLYWAITLVYCAVAFVPGIFDRFNFNSIELLKSLLFVPYLDASGHVYPLVIPGWTLNYEMFFYLIFTLSLFARGPRLVALLAIALLFGVGVIGHFGDPVLATYTSPMLLEFAAGLTLSLWNPLRRVWAGWAALALGVAGFVAVWLLGDLGIVGSMGLDRVSVLGAPAYLVVAGALCLERLRAWPQLRFARTLGDASYSLYLTHPIVVSAVSKVAGRNAVLEVLLGLTLCTLLALGCFRFFEKPVGKFLRARIDVRQGAAQVALENKT